MRTNDRPPASPGRAAAAAPTPPSAASSLPRRCAIHASLAAALALLALCVGCADDTGDEEPCNCTATSCTDGACALALSLPEACFGDASSLPFMVGDDTVDVRADGTTFLCDGIAPATSSSVSSDALPSWPSGVEASCQSAGAASEWNVCNVEIEVGERCAGVAESFTVSVDDEEVGVASLDAPLRPCIFVKTGEERRVRASGGGLLVNTVLSGCGVGGTLRATIECN